MSDILAPFGLRKVRGKSSVDTSAGGRTAYKATVPTATRLVKGELATIAVGGTVAKDTGTATAKPIGVFDGFEYTDSFGKFRIANEVPAGITGEVTAFVIDDPEAVYEVQASATLGQNALWTNAAIVQTAAGVFGAAKVGLNAATIANTATLPLKIVGIDAKEVGSAYPIVQVVLNTHVAKSASGNAPV
jgi:hypothetical protein